MNRGAPYRSLVTLVLALVFIIASEHKVIAQSLSGPKPPSAKSDSVLIAKKKQSFFSFFTTLIGIHKQKQDTTIVKHKRNDSTAIQHKLDTNKPKSKSCSCNPFPKIIQSGQIDVGYEYGLLPFYVPGNYPAGGMVTNGQLAFDAFKVPLNATFFYSNFKGVPGLNNYFRVAFDANRYKQQLAGGLQKKEGSLTQREDSLKNERKELMGKMYYLTSLKQQLGSTPAFPQVTKLGIPDASQEKNNTNMGSMQKDTSLIKVNTPKDTSVKSTGTQVTNDEKKANVLMKDSLRKLDSAENRYLGRLKLVEKLIDETEKKIDEIENAKKNINSSSAEQSAGKELTGKQKFLANTNKLEVGMVYPSFSTFMVSGLPVNGFLIERQDQDFYLAATAGVTVNNLLMTTNSVQNTLALTRNLYNFFDFGNVSSGRRVIAVMTGLGKKDGNHIYVGFMKGWGLISYTDSAYLSSPNSSSSREKNDVLEIDGRIKIGQHQNIDAVIAKSVVYQSSHDSSLSNLLDPSYHSLAGLLRYKGTLTKTGTTLTLTTRYIQPFFYSFGAGFLQSDNLRYEARIDQILSSKFKVSVFYRTDVDNLYGLLPYTNKLRNAGITASLKITKHLMLKGTYNPVFQDVTSLTAGTVLHNRNEISQVNLTHTIMGSRVTFISNIYYSYYKLNSGDTSVNMYTNAGYTGTLQLGKSRWTFSVNYFKVAGTDTSGAQTLLIGQEASFMFFKKLQLTVGLKYSISNIPGDPLGWKCQIGYLIGKCYSLEADYEKPVIGDFYNNYPLPIVQKFPYFCTVKFGYIIH